MLKRSDNIGNQLALLMESQQKHSTLTDSAGATANHSIMYNIRVSVYMPAMVFVQRIATPVIMVRAVRCSRIGYQEGAFGSTESRKRGQAPENN